MSQQHTTAVFERSEAKGDARILLLAIADEANERGEASCTIAYLAAKARMSQANVRLTLHALQRSGELSFVDDRFLVAVGQ